jgi:hypothetical protein
VADHTPASSATGSSAFQTIDSTLQTKYSATPLPRWSLEHRLSHSTSTSPGDEKPADYHHVLNLSYYPGKTYLHTHSHWDIAEPRPHNPKDVVVAIPSSQSESFVKLLNTKLSAMWTQKQALVVRDGLAFALGELVVRVGELRSARGVGGSPPTLQGVVVCIESRAEDPGSQDNMNMDKGKGVTPPKQETEQTVRDVQEMIKDLWRNLDVQGRKEGIKQAFSSYGGESEVEAVHWEVRMWCEILRLRS